MVHVLQCVGASMSLCVGCIAVLSEFCSVLLCVSYVVWGVCCVWVMQWVFVCDLCRAGYEL